ncbi:efflux RND transporter periplasmic adaptor subunit [Lignipirellula cremea]|uniref:Multidrug efflux system subunit MdtA n=1 Tax=Lignipirellula cremea TaxID=2528010 RepID=A0A518DPP1_9BACT|nr:efflux RND transporter periplasmic adaptor subunit [Lignipirellula cremea]QDU93799.1 multidrug efflux system subunit MdtA [Lignipirellula cremea]
MSGKIDLSQLAVDRAEPARPRLQPRRRWFSRYVLPVGILLSFGGLLAWATKDSLLPSQPVTVLPVIVAKAQVQQSGSPLFQAAGWIEPRPAAVVVSSLAPGVIETMHVVEGQLVEAGEPLALLLDVDARIELRQAQAEQDLRAADREAAAAELEAAQLAFDNPLQLQADLAEAQSVLAQIEAELQGIPSGLAAAHTRLDLAEQNVENKRSAKEAIAGRLLRDAESELATAAAVSQQLVVRKPLLQRQHQALQDKATALASQLELRLEEKRRLGSAAAALKAAEARLEQSRIAVQTAELQLERMIVKSPITGRVLSIHAAAGMRVVGIDPHSEKGSSAVVTLYDPTRLQVRVDVRLEDVPQVASLQTVRIETASAGGVLLGRVIGVTSVADIQKNTLQVKVAIDNPPQVIRPEMLAQVTFMAPERPAASEAEQEQLRVLAPRQLVQGSAGDAFIWVADLAGKRAEKRSISLGMAGDKDLVEIVSGLTPTDKLISGGRESLTPGQRIRVTAEDQSMGSSAMENPRVASGSPSSVPASLTER